MNYVSQFNIQFIPSYLLLLFLLLSLLIMLMLFLSNKPNKTKQKLLDQTKPTKPNQIYQMKTFLPKQAVSTKLDQIYQTNQTLTNLIWPAKNHIIKMKFIDQIGKCQPYKSIKVLIIWSKPTCLSLPWAWPSSAPACSSSSCCDRGKTKSTPSLEIDNKSMGFTINLI